MLRRVAIAVCLVGIACADDSVTGPAVSPPQLSMVFAHDDAAGVMAKYGPPEISETEFGTDLIAVTCTPQIPVHFYSEWHVRTERWAGYDPDTGLSELYAVDHNTYYRRYTNLETGKVVDGRQGFSFGIFWILSDDLSVNEIQTWQAGNVLSITDAGGGRIRYKSGLQTVVTDWSGPAPVREVSFNGTIDLDFEGVCAALLDTSESE